MPVWISANVIKECEVGCVLAALLLGTKHWYSFVLVLHSNYQTDLLQSESRSKNTLKSAKEEVGLRQTFTYLRKLPRKDWKSDDILFT